MNQIFKNFAEAAERELERKRQAEHDEAVRFWRNLFSGNNKGTPVYYIDSKGVNAPDYLDGDYAEGSLPQLDNWAAKDRE